MSLALLPAQEVLGSLGWIDITALAILLVFCVLGLFRGTAWQFLRLLTLVAAMVAAVLWGDAVSAQIEHWFTAEFRETSVPRYIAFAGVFLVALIALALFTHLISRLIASDSPSVTNRLGGGVLGAVTGALVVLALMTAVLMFARDGSAVVQAAERSYTLDVSRTALDALGEAVPEPLREVYDPTRPTAPPVSQPR